MVAVEHPDPLEEAKFNTESMGVPARARPNDAFVDQASARDKSYVGMVPGEQLQVDADELSSGNEAHANFFGVFQLGMIAGRASCSRPGYLALAVEQRHASVPVWPLATGGIPARCR